jgi:hypothetical protein
MATSVFLSYSKKDHFFAELAEIKLAEARIKLWRDKGKLRAGSDWREGIEKAISEHDAVLVALSASSAQSAYVTYEWAYALGKGKALVPVMLDDCDIHPKLQTIQYLDFSIAAALPWDSLIERIKEIEPDAEQTLGAAAEEAVRLPPQPEDPRVQAILSYLDQRGYQLASFDRLRRRVDESVSDEQLSEIIQKNPTLFRPAQLASGKPGLGKVIP